MPIISQIAPDDAVVPAEAHLAEAIAFAAVLGPAAEEASLHLFKSGEVDATSDTTSAAYEAAECDFTGYAAKTLVGVTPEPYLEADGSYLVTIPSQQWNHGAVGTANTVGGWWLVDDNGNILMAGNLPDPQTLTGPTDSLVLVLSRRFGP